MRWLRAAAWAVTLQVLVIPGTRADAGLTAMDAIVRAACECAQEREDGVDAAVSCAASLRDYGTAEVRHRDGWDATQRGVEQRLRSVLSHCLTHAHSYRQSLDALALLPEGVGGGIAPPKSVPSWYRAATSDLHVHRGTLVRLRLTGGEVVAGLLERAGVDALVLRLSRSDGGGTRTLSSAEVQRAHVLILPQP